MVLEARYKAEKIGYPVVGEKTKYSDEVVDYDIRDEETKDTAAEINANNQTTTGMATVIPGVNAPKLLENTSIIKANLSLFVGTINVLNNYTEHEDNPKYGKVIVTTTGGEGLEFDDYLITFKTKGTFYLDIKQQPVNDTVVSGYRVTTYVRKNLQAFLEGHFPYGPNGFTYSGAIKVLPGDTLGIAGCIWNINSAVAPSGQGPIYDISLTQIS